MGPPGTGPYPLWGQEPSGCLYWVTLWRGGHLSKPWIHFPQGQHSCVHLLERDFPAVLPLAFPSRNNMWPKMVLQCICWGLRTTQREGPTHWFPCPSLGQRRWCYQLVSLDCFFLWRKGKRECLFFLFLWRNMGFPGGSSGSVCQI